MLAYQRLVKLHDSVRFEITMTKLSDAFSEIEELLLKAYHGEDDNGGNEDLGDP
jgi:hypothetical protein